MSNTNPATPRSKVPKRRKKTLYALCEEHDEKFAVRQFPLLCVFNDKGHPKNALKIRKKADNYGYISKLEAD